MPQSTIGNFTYLFLKELVEQKQNKPTKSTLYLYIYHLFIYNLSTLLTRYNPYLDNFDLPIWYIFQKNKLKFRTDKENMLDNLIFVGSQELYNVMFPNGNTLKNKDIKKDFGINENKIIGFMRPFINEWAQAHFNSRKGMFDEPALENSNVSFDNAFKADINVWDNKVNDPLKWTELAVPTGKVTSQGIPVIDKNNSASYSIQKYLGNNWGNHRGFSLDLNKKFTIADVSNQVATVWEDKTKPTDLKREVENILSIYENLDDSKKCIADLFAGSGSLNLPPPGLMFIVGNMMSQKYQQNIIDEINMYFVLASGLLDASIAAWWYKAKLRQARPVNTIRHFYKGKSIKSWTPGKGTQNIDGGAWLPYQTLTFVTPPFPDMASGHTVFSTAGCKLLQWWFNTDIFYDGFTLVTIPNANLISNTLDQSQKLTLIGEFCIRQNKSEIEQTGTPAKDFKLVVKTLTELYQLCGISRVYGGIHYQNTNELSQTVGISVYENVKNKLNNIGFRSPYQ